MGTFLGITFFFQMLINGMFLASVAAFIIIYTVYKLLLTPAAKKTHGLAKSWFKPAGGRNPDYTPWWAKRGANAEEASYDHDARFYKIAVPVAIVFIVANSAFMAYGILS